MKPKILVTREVFDETIAYLREHCEVEANQAVAPLDPASLRQKMADRHGIMCALTDRVDAELLAECVRLACSGAG